MCFKAACARCDHHCIVRIVYFVTRLSVSHEEMAISLWPRDLLMSNFLQGVLSVLHDMFEYLATALRLPTASSARVHCGVCLLNIYQGFSKNYFSNSAHHSLNLIKLRAGSAVQISPFIIMY